MSLSTDEMLQMIGDGYPDHAIVILSPSRTQRESLKRGRIKELTWNASWGLTCGQGPTLHAAIEKLLETLTSEKTS